VRKLACNLLGSCPANITHQRNGKIFGNEKLLIMTFHIDFTSKQTHLLIGQVGISRSHPDYYALYLGNHIFGAHHYQQLKND
jgi:predicted Zn-dependent peptidase